MKQRERILAVGVGVLVAGYLGNWIYGSMIQGPLQEKRDTIAKLQNDIKTRRAKVRKARVAADQLAVYERQSLPSNLEVAQSLYQDFLLDKVGRAGFKMPNVDSAEPIKKGDSYRLQFSVRGRGTLEQLTQFLYDFYHADHLHQVQRIGVTPVAKTNELDLNFGIEALVLNTADRKDQLNDGVSQRLASTKLADYRSIVDRNLFGQASAGTDPADYAFLTAILDVDGSPQAWLTVRTTGEILKLNQGQSFEIGQFHGTIAAINAPDIVIDADEERWLLTLGEQLSQAVALPPGF